MIHLVDRAVEQFLRDAVPLPENAVDISFDAPDRTWGASVSRPTVNIFLWEVTRNPSFGHAGLQQRRAPDGRVERRPANPIVDLHYLITGWATEQRDEHQLLGSILSCVLAHSVLPESSLPEQLASTSWITMSLAVHEKRAPGEFWSALDGRLKPGLELELSLPLDVFSWSPAGPPTESISVAVKDRNGSAGGPHLGTTRQQVPPSRFGRDSVGGVADREDTPLRRRRYSGALVMEGRAAEPRRADPPG